MKLNLRNNEAGQQSYKAQPMEMESDHNAIMMM